MMDGNLGVNSIFVVVCVPTGWNVFIVPSRKQRVWFFQKI